MKKSIFMGTIKNLSRRKGSRKRLLFTLMVLLLVQIGAHIPTYGVDKTYMQLLIAMNGTMSFLNAMTGSALSNVAFLALSISPYITASIIMQLLAVAIPSLEQMVKDDGPTGKEKYEKITYIAGGVLGYMEALAMAVGLGRSGLLLSYTWYNVLIVTIIWGTGALLALLAGKAIDKRGIGNGISLILLFNIAASLPSDLIKLYRAVSGSSHIALGIFGVMFATVVIVALFAFCVHMDGAEKKIPVQYSMRAGRYMPEKSYIPLKVWMAGVVPVIFASSMLSLPLTIISLFGGTSGAGTVAGLLNSSNWFNLSAPGYTIGYLLYAALVIFFSYFYVSITFNSHEMADNLKKNGGMIPGVRPGIPTVKYLERQKKFTILIGSLGMLLVATVPILASGMLGVSSLSLGGTSVIIICSVVLETKQQLEAESLASRATSPAGTGLFGIVPSQSHRDPVLSVRRINPEREQELKEKYRRR